MPTSKNSTTHSPQTVKKNLNQVFMLNFRLLDNIWDRQQPLVHTNSAIYRSSSNSHKCMTTKNIQLYIFTFKLKVSGRKNAMQNEYCVEAYKKRRGKKLRSSQARLWFIIPLVDSLHLHSYYCCYFSYPWASNSLTLKKIVAIFSIFIRFKWDKHCWIFS